MLTSKEAQYVYNCVQEAVDAIETLDPAQESETLNVALDRLYAVLTLLAETEDEEPVELDFEDRDYD